MAHEALPKIENLEKKYREGDIHTPSVLMQLQHWFAAHPNHPTVFDMSSLGFYNWLKKNYPNL